MTPHEPTGEPTDEFKPAVNAAELIKNPEAAEMFKLTSDMYDRAAEAYGLNKDDPNISGFKLGIPGGITIHQGEKLYPIAIKKDSKAENKFIVTGPRRGDLIHVTEERITNWQDAMLRHAMRTETSGFEIASRISENLGALAAAGVIEAQVMLSPVISKSEQPQ